MSKPIMPAELKQIIAAHQALFGKTVMMAEEAQDATSKEGEKPSDDGGRGGKDAILADLAKERDARQALEIRLQDLEPIAAQFAELSKVFTKDGEKPDVVGNLAAQVAEMKQRIEAEDERKARETLARTVAKASELSDIEDIVLIANQPDEAAMKALADRLAKAKLPGTPKPDRSAGRGGGDSGKVASVQAGRDLYRDMHPTTNQ